MPLESRASVEGRDVAGEAQLLVRAQAGDMAAFEGLVELHRERIFRLAVHLLGSEDEAAEVLQESFLAAYRNLNQFRGEAQFGTWVYRIAANAALQLGRRRRVRQSVEVPLETATNPDGDGEMAHGRDVEGQALDVELRRAIERAAEQLGPESREVFVLKDLEGLSYEEIGEITGVSVPALKSRLHRARLSMREAIVAFYSERVLP